MQGGWGSPRCPTFLALFVKLTTFNSYRFCCVSIVTDQTPKPVIGSKLKPLSSAWISKDICGEAFLQAKVTGSTCRWSWLVIQGLFSLTWLLCNCATAYQHFVTCLEQTGFSKLKDSAVKFTSHTCTSMLSVFTGWWRNVVRWFTRINLAAGWLDIHTLAAPPRMAFQWPVL